MMGFFAPCTKSVIAEMRAVSPEQTQKMNHRLRDTLQKEKLTTRFRCYCGLKMEK